MKLIMGEDEQQSLSSTERDATEGWRERDGTEGNFRTPRKSPTHLEVGEDEREGNHGCNCAVLLVCQGACAGELQNCNSHHHQRGCQVQHIPAVCQGPYVQNGQNTWLCRQVGRALMLQQLMRCHELPMQQPTVPHPPGRLEIGLVLDCPHLTCLHVNVPQSLRAATQTKALPPCLRTMVLMSSK
eukprot:1151493-Pelagomonas_calceolata.AAC.11